MSFLISSRRGEKGMVISSPIEAERYRQAGFTVAEQSPPSPSPPSVSPVPSQSEGTTASPSSEGSP